MHLLPPFFGFASIYRTKGKVSRFRAVGMFENPVGVGVSSNVVVLICPLVEIEFTDLLIWGGNDPPPKPGLRQHWDYIVFVSFFLGYCCIMQVRFCLWSESRVVHSILKINLKKIQKNKRCFFGKVTGMNKGIYLVEQIRPLLHELTYV